MVDCPLAAVLTAAAARLGEPDLARLAAGLTDPVRVRVSGRPGAGVTTVVRALRAAGVWICAPGEEPDIEVGVVVGDPAGEDGRPDLAVLNKADLIGAAAPALARAIGERTGIPTVVLSALAAVTCVDAAVDDETLAGLAAALGVLRPDADRVTVRAALRRASGVDAVRGAIDLVAAPVRYRRVEAVLAELDSRTAGPDAARLATFLSGDDVVLSRMLAAAEVVRAAGLPVPSVPADPLAAAIRWHRYASGPVSDLHRACGADLARGALRLWHRRPRPAQPARPVATRPAAQRAGLQQSRVEAAARARAACAALRTELQSGAARTSRAEDFVRQARHRLDTVASEVDADITAGLAAAGADPDWTGAPGLPEEPLLRSPHLESRLAALLGLTFGAGAALTLGRLLADLLPRCSTAVAAGCAVIGLTLGLWVTRARRLLSERAAADRWVQEATAGLRSVLEDQVTARFAAAEVMLLTSVPFGGSPRR